MKDLLNIEHQCYKIHTLLMKNIAPPSIDTPPPHYMDYPHTPPLILKENLAPPSPFYAFSKIPTPYK